MKLVDVMLMAMMAVVYAQEEKERGEDPTLMIQAAEHYINLVIELDTANDMPRSIEILQKKLEVIKNA